MIPELSEVRLLRRELGLTQKQLADMAGVSQSLIAKIERDLVQPSYANVKRLLESLEREKSRRHPAVTVGKTCSRSILWVEAHQTVREAAGLMQKHGYSQVPVRRRGLVVGSVSDRLLSEALSSADRPESLGEMRVEEIMGDPFPQIPENTPLQVASALLQFTPAVMVVRKNEPVGVLTKSDLLKVLLK